MIHRAEWIHSAGYKTSGLFPDMTADEIQAVIEKAHGQEIKIVELKPCPACNALPGKPCTQPTDNGRKAVSWLHLSREVNS